MARKVLSILILISRILAFSTGVSAIKMKPSPTERSKSKELSCELVSEPPPKVTCSLRGEDTPGAPYDHTTNQTVASLDICRDYCLSWVLTGENQQFPECSAFNYNFTSMLCTLHSRTLNDRQGYIINNSDSDTIFYDSECYSCDRSCPLTNPRNILNNGDFEDSSEYYGPWVVAYDTDPAEIVQPGYRSANAIRCPLGRCAFSQPIVTCPGEHYLFTATLKVVWNGTKANYPPAEGYPTLSILVDPSSPFLGYQWRKNGIDEDHPSVFAINSWEIISGSFVPNPGYKREKILTAIEYYSPYNPGYEPIFIPYFDDISIVPLPEDITKTGSNLLKNGGFENGKLAPWKFMYSREDHNKGTHTVLRNASLSQSSKYGFFFTDRLRKLDYYGYHIGVAGFTLTNAIPPTDPEKLYIAGFKWKSNLADVISLYVGDMQWSILDTGGMVPSDHGEHAHYSWRIFRGSRRPLNLSISFDGNYYYRSPKLTNVYLDDVTVHEAIL